MRARAHPWQELQKELDAAKSDAKSLIAKLRDDARVQPCSVVGDTLTFHYIVDGDVVYLTIADRAFSKRSALLFLERIKEEFVAKCGEEVARASRPFQFMSFERVLSRHQDEFGRGGNRRRPDDVHALNSELRDVGDMMTKNLEDVLQRGEMLSSVSDKSSKLKYGAERLAKQSKQLNWMAFYRKWAPIVAVIVLVVLLLYLRFA